MYGIGAIVAVILIAGGYFYYQHTQTAKQTNNPAAAADEVKKLVEAVGKLIDLPTGETPTIATVTDIAKLKDQPFFQKAQNGDKVLIYGKAREAYLYDPVANKVISVAPLNVGTASAQIASPSATPKPTAKPTPKPTVTPNPK